jgi:hypothetical protein
MSSKKTEVLPHQVLPTPEGYMQTAVALGRDRLFSLQASNQRLESLLDRLNQFDGENRDQTNGGTALK